MRDGHPEIGDNVWHFLFKGGWVDSFVGRKHVYVVFYRTAMRDDPLRELERADFDGVWTERFGGCWYIDI